MSKTIAIRLVKKADGSAVISCTRPDGSQTWQRHRRHAAFFPLHDLTHYVVETILGLRHGFYGLLAAGWNITDFGERDLPDGVSDEAVFAEAIVNLLDGERATGERPDADAFNRALSDSMGSMQRPMLRLVTDDELRQLRAGCLEWATRWYGLSVDDQIALEFNVSSASSRS